MIVCTNCFGTDVLCEAIINPNTKEIDHFTDESLDYGECQGCECSLLIDTEWTVERIDDAYNSYKKLKGKEPLYAVCGIVFKGEGGAISEGGIIKLNTELEDDDENIFYYCKDIEDLKFLAQDNSGEFMIASAHFVEFS